MSGSVWLHVKPFSGGSAKSGSKSGRKVDIVDACQSAHLLKNFPIVCTATDYDFQIFSNIKTSLVNLCQLKFWYGLYPYYW
jgi:hypothetical protein